MLKWFRRESRSKQSPSCEKPLTRKEKIRQKYDAYYIGTILHYYSNIQVGIIRVEKGSLSVGDIIYIQGVATQIQQTVTSIEYEHQRVKKVGPGYEVGVLVESKVKPGDDVYIIQSST